MRKAALLIGLLPALAWGEARTFTATPGSTITYVLVHRFKQVKGTSKELTAKARLLPDGTLQVAARVPVATFDSGNGNRDANMQEATEAAKFPYVEFKGVAAGVSWPSKMPATASVTLKGTLTFHGVQKPLELPLQLAFKSATEVAGSGGFAISLEAHGVERPALMFVKVDDAVKIRIELLLRAEAP
jgi:polyisoprenoid-binding protein YceI